MARDDVVVVILIVYRRACAVREAVEGTGEKDRNVSRDRGWTFGLDAEVGFGGVVLPPLSSSIGALPI